MNMLAESALGFRLAVRLGSLQCLDILGVGRLKTGIASC